MRRNKCSTTTPGVVGSTGESLQKIPGKFLWCPLDVGSARQQGGVVGEAGESLQKIPGKFLWYRLDVGSAQQQGVVARESGTSREIFPVINVGNFPYMLPPFT
ncbi:unnamed protein product [Ectocarpus sp. 12 AP-2014]